MVLARLFSILLALSFIHTAYSADVTPAIQDSPPIMLWRLQKVGSSSLLSILLSYAFRYNILPRRKYGRNTLCKKIESCFPVHSFNNTLQLMTMIRAVYARKFGRLKTTEGRAFDHRAFGMSLQHEICNLDPDLIQAHLPCAFHTAQNNYYHKHIHELFMVRDPISRMVSAYYFWGELVKLKLAQKRRKKNKSSKLLRLGNAEAGSHDLLFKYHGNESTVPPSDVALAYASKLPLVYGNQMGASLSFTAFARDNQTTIAQILSNRMMTMVLERMDESLIAMRHYLNWSLADVIIVLSRKTYSNHPQLEQWPKDAIQAIKAKLYENGEISVYETANRKLDQRLLDLRNMGINIDKELTTLRNLRSNVSKVYYIFIYCLIILKSVLVVLFKRVS